MTSEEALQRQTARMLSVVSYQIEATFKNGKTWKSPTIERKQLEADKVSESDFIQYAKSQLFTKPNYNGAKVIKIVKIYDYWNGKHTEKETIYKEER